MTEETWIRESRVGCQNRESGESSGHPRYKQTKEAMPHERIVSDKSSSEPSDQKRLSIQSWKAGPKRGKVANSMVGSFHVILVQRTESHHGEIATSTEQ